MTGKGMKMNRLGALCVALLAVVLGARVFAQAGPLIGPTDAIGQDYSDADMTTYQVNTFQAQWDGGAWVSVGIPPTVIDAGTPAGSKTYKFIPTFTGGSHTLSVRVCNVVGCSAPGAVFPFVLGVVPSAPTTPLRKIAR